MRTQCISESSQRLPSDHAPVDGRSSSPATGGLLSGLLAGVCCVTGALAVGLGLGGATFITTVMDRYQVYFMLASLGLMAIMIARTIRRSGSGNRGIRAITRAVRRPVTMMVIVYGLTLVLAFAASSAAGLG